MDTETKDIQEDARLTEARSAAQVLRDRPYLDPEVIDEIASDIDNLVAFAEERLRVNVGLVRENQELRRKVQELSQGGTA